MVKISFIACCFIFLGTTRSSAMILTNGSESEFRIGEGIRIDTEQRLPTCLTSASTQFDSDKVDATTAGAGSVRNMQVRSEIIRSRVQMDSYSRQNTSLKVRYLALSGAFKYSSEDSTSFSKDQVVVGLSASVEYGRKYLNAPKLAKKYKQLGDQNIDEFFNQCGHEFVSGVELGQGINVILKTVDSQLLNSSVVAAKLEAALDGLSKGGANLEASVSTVALSLLKYSQLEIQVVAYGLGGINQFAKVLTEKKDVEDIAHDLGNILMQVNPKDATVTSFLTSPYGEVARSPVSALANIKRIALNRIVESIVEVTDDMNSLKKYLAKDLLSDLGDLCESDLTKYIESNKKYMSCSDYMSALSVRVANLSSAQSKLIGELRRCMEAPINDVCDGTDLNIYIDLIKQEFLWPGGYKALLLRAKYRQFVEGLVKSHQNP